MDNSVNSFEIDVEKEDRLICEQFADILNNSIYGKLGIHFDKYIVEQIYNGIKSVSFGRETPRKVVSGRCSYWCPICGKFLRYHDEKSEIEDKYCRLCGQRISFNGAEIK